MVTAFIGIGSNLGDTRHHCIEAVERMEGISGCEVTGRSGLYLTEPVGVEDQGWYMNGVVSLITTIPALSLITILLSIETNMGRVRDKKWGPRIIDLDILMFGMEIIRSDTLTVPHPLMHQRRFVLAPMVDLAPDLIHPSLGKTMTELLLSIPEDDQIIRPVEDH